MPERLFQRLRTWGFSTQRNIPSLDGLRAVSILFVLLSHLHGTRYWPFSHIEVFRKYGEYGVRVFFIISGFLITSILLSELNRTGKISLPRFYFRRALRLFPACYVFVGITAYLATIHFVQLHRWDLWCSFTYTMNYYYGRSERLGHLWSLAVEEQFYLLWPALLLMLGTIRGKRLLWRVLLIVPFLRLLLWPYAGAALDFIARTDALATGCLLALIRTELHEDPRYQRLLKSRWFFVIPLIAVGGQLIPSTKVHWLIAESMMNICIAISADWVMLYPQSRIGRVLNWPAIAFAGVLSYSLYLWQQLFLNDESSSWICAFPQNLLLAFAAALASYLLVEAPFLRLRMALERRFRAFHAAPDPAQRRCPQTAGGV